MNHLHVLFDTNEYHLSNPDRVITIHQRNYAIPWLPRESMNLMRMLNREEFTHVPYVTQRKLYNSKTYSITGDNPRKLHLWSPLHKFQEAQKTRISSPILIFFNCEEGFLTLNSFFYCFYWTTHFFSAPLLSSLLPSLVTPCSQFNQDILSSLYSYVCLS